jgi:hypothetical protein
MHKPYSCFKQATAKSCVNCISLLSGFAASISQATGQLHKPFSGFAASISQVMCPLHKPSSGFAASNIAEAFFSLSSKHQPSHVSNA